MTTVVRTPEVIRAELEEAIKLNLDELAQTLLREYYVVTGQEVA